VHDWKAIVREKLSPLPLSNERAEDVIEEIAQQLESAYNEARGQGAKEADALAKAYEQTGNWEKLRGRVFESVEGGLLPVWQQRGLFAPRRFPVWIALTLTFAFFAAPAFRQAVAILPIPGINLTVWKGLSIWARPEINDAVSDADLRRLARAGDKNRYARALAFVALHSLDNQAAEKAAKKAIALDPQLTWVAASVSHAIEPVPGRDPQPWIDRLKSWDPGNAYPYLLEASTAISDKRGELLRKYAMIYPDLGGALSSNTAWRAAMAKALAAPRVDFYRDREFALDRQVLADQGFDNPEALFTAAASQPFPDFIGISSYFALLCDDATAAANSGRTEEALAEYESVLKFSAEVDASYGFSSAQPFPEYRKRALGGLLPLVTKSRRSAELAKVEAALAAFAENDSTVIVTREYREREAMGARAAQIVFIGGLCVGVFGIASFTWLLLIAILKWKPRLSRILNRCASALCFAPPALLLASLTLFLGYFPYAQPLSAISSPLVLVDVYGPLLDGFLTAAPSLPAEAWLSRMFWPCIWCGAAAISGVVLLRWQRHQRAMRGFR
jgi:hypothetical protein